MDIEIGQIVSQIIAFLIMLAVLRYFAWKPLLQLMDQRREKISNEFAMIEQRQQEVDEMRTSYEEKLGDINNLAKKIGQAELAKAREKAKEIEKEAQSRGHEIMANAQIAAEDELVKAKGQLKKEIVSLTIAATEAVLKKNMDKDLQSALVAEYIAEAKLK